MKKENFGYVVFLSVVAAIGGILFGYDTAVISGTTSIVATQFGLDTIQLGWYVGCALIGSIAGVASAGVISDRFGRKKSMLFAAFMFSLSAIGCAICGSFTELVVYRIIRRGGYRSCLYCFSYLYLRGRDGKQARCSCISLSVGDHHRFPFRLFYKLVDTFSG